MADPQTDKITPAPSQRGEVLMATINSHAALIRVLIAESEIVSRRPNQTGDANRKVLRAIELAVAAHRRGGCTSAMLVEMARVEEEIRRMA